MSLEFFEGRHIEFRYRILPLGSRGCVGILLYDKDIVLTILGNAKNMHFLHFVKTIVEANRKVMNCAYVYNSTKTYSCHLHTDYEHAQTFFSRVAYNANTDYFVAGLHIKRTTIFDCS
jgi:hypothetical protein